MMWIWCKTSWYYFLLLHMHGSEWKWCLFRIETNRRCRSAAIEYEIFIWIMFLVVFFIHSFIRRFVQKTFHRLYFVCYQHNFGHDIDISVVMIKTSSILLTFFLLLFHINFYRRRTKCCFYLLSLPIIGWNQWAKFI